MRDYKKTKNNLDKASKISEEFDVPVMEGRIYLAYAQLYIQEDKVDDAFDNLDEALDIFMDINNKLRASDVLIMMGFLYIKKKKIRKAKKVHKRAKKLLGNLEGSYRNMSLDKLQKEIEKNE
jgi:tetratricopeptide (TPR) repeat protein